MSGILDTSVLVRYLTGTPPDLSRQAAQISDGNQDLFVTDIVLLEAAYVLTSVYQVPRELVVDHLIAFLRKENVLHLSLEKDLVLQALRLCRPSGRVSFADALIWANAQTTRNKVVYSFDVRFPSTGIQVWSK